MPVRKTSQRTKTTVRHLVNSSKVGRVVECESNLERDLALLLEFSTNVVSFEEQPLRLTIPASPKSFQTTPDFSVLLDTRETELLEVKYQSQANKHAERLEVIKRHLATQGMVYRVMTEKSIRASRMVLHNCQYLKSFKKLDGVTLDQLKALAPKHPIRLDQLIEQVGSDTAIQIIAHQLVFFDYDTPLNPKTILRPSLPGDFVALYLNS